MYHDEGAIKELVQIQEMSKHSIGNEIEIDGMSFKFSNHLFPFGFEMMFPDSFEEMKPEYARRKYLMEDRPKYIYSNSDTTVNFCFDLFPATTTPLWDRIEQYKAIIKKMNPSNIIYLSDVFQTDKGEVALFSYSTVGLDENIYVVVFFTDSKDNELYASFNCPQSKRGDWEPLVFEMVKTIVPVENISDGEVK